MRMNLHSDATAKPPQSLLILWVRMLASEFLVEEKKAGNWLFDQNCQKFVAKFLRSQGWKVRAYASPDRGSHGFLIADDCENFVAWRLAQD